MPLRACTSALASYLWGAWSSSRNSLSAQSLQEYRAFQLFCTKDSHMTGVPLSPLPSWVRTTWLVLEYIEPETHKIKALSDTRTEWQGILTTVEFPATNLRLRFAQYLLLSIPATSFQKETFYINAARRTLGVGILVDAHHFEVEGHRVNRNLLRAGIILIARKMMSLSERNVDICWAVCM